MEVTPIPSTHIDHGTDEPDGEAANAKKQKAEDQRYSGIWSNSGILFAIFVSYKIIQFNLLNSIYVNCQIWTVCVCAWPLLIYMLLLSPTTFSYLQ